MDWVDNNPKISTLYHPTTTRTVNSIIRAATTIRILTIVWRLANLH